MKDREEEERTIGVVREAKERREIKLNRTFDEAWLYFKRLEYETFVVVDTETGELFHCVTGDNDEGWRDPHAGYVKIVERAENFAEVVEIMKKHHLVPSDGYPTEEELRRMEEEED
jgi:hypothetical protein